MKILSINAGKVQSLLEPREKGGRLVASAIHKRSVSDLSNPHTKAIGQLGLEGDEQANLAVHGGEDKALYAYPFEHYGFWQDSLLRETKSTTPLEFGAFGENLTLEGFKESEVFVGDRWRIASVLLEVVRFREPCFKFNIKMGWSGAAKAMVQSKTTGWYLKVLEEGSIKAGDTVQVIHGNKQVSVLVKSSSFYARSAQQDLWN